MKKILFLCLLMAQIFTSCAQAQKEDITVYNDRMAALKAQMGALEKEYVGIQKAVQGNPTPEQQASMGALIHSADSIYALQMSLAREVIDKCRDTKEVALYIEAITDELSVDELDQLCDPQAVYYNEPAMERPKKILAQLQLRKPGLQYTDMTMQDLDGKEMKLSQYVGKGYLLVDFWASWCGPCRAEMPNVVEGYKRYHDKGFEIVGVSFDSKQDAWTAAVKKLGMTWPQMSDLKGWDCAAVRVYGVNSIPSNILLDAQGKIIACDLRGEQLLQKLAEIYK